MAGNGNLGPAQLAPIPGGQLANDAAAAWNAGPAKAGLRPLGPNSSYRSYSGQQYYWNLYQSGRGNLAARPGTSNHGWGRAVDLAAPWMRTWINNHGARYGWKKVEAFSEWWHVNYVGGFKAKPPKPNPLKHLTRAGRNDVERMFYHRKQAIKQAKSGKGPKYKKHVKWRKHYRNKVAKRARKAHGRRARILKAALRQTGATHGTHLKIK